MSKPGAFNPPRFALNNPHGVSDETSETLESNQETKEKENHSPDSEEQSEKEIG